MGLVPAGPVTVTSTVPPTFWASPGGASAVIEVGEFDNHARCGAAAEAGTVLPAVKFVPVTVTVVPPDAGPEAGETALTVGAPAAGGPYVNWSAVLVALVPPGPVTITSTTPDPDGASAVIEVGEFTTTPVAALPPKATVLPWAAKFVPVTVTA